MCPCTAFVRRWAIRSMLLLGSLALGWLLVSGIVAFRLTRRQAPPCDEPLPHTLATDIEAFRLTTCDGESLGAWFLAGPPHSSIVLLLHGNGGRRSDCLAQARLLQQLRCSVLLLTLRAHGDSTGQLNDLGLGARQDVVAAVDWIEAHHPGQPIIVWGQSLGSAAALFAAGELGNRVNAYLLECPYQDLRTAVWNRLRLRLPPGADVIAYRGLVTAGYWVLPDLDRISPLEAAAGVPTGLPIAILAGQLDRRATLEEAQAIANRLGDRAELIVFEHADHLRLMDSAPEEYRQAVARLLRRGASS